MTLNEQIQRVIEIACHIDKENKTIYTARTSDNRDITGVNNFNTTTHQGGEISHHTVKDIRTSNINTTTEGVEESAESGEVVEWPSTHTRNGKNSTGYPTVRSNSGSKNIGSTVDSPARRTTAPCDQHNNSQSNNYSSTPSVNVARRQDERRDEATNDVEQSAPYTPADLNTTRKATTRSAHDKT